MRSKRCAVQNQGITLNNKPTERSRNSNFFLEAPIDFSRSPSLPFFSHFIPAWLNDNRNAGLPISYTTT